MSAMLLRPCAGSSGFNITSDHNLNLELVGVSSALSSIGFRERVCVEKRILIMEKEGLEYTIYPSGRFLIKPKNEGERLEQEQAEREANRLLRVFRGCGAKD